MRVESILAKQCKCKGERDMSLLLFDMKRGLGREIGLGGASLGVRLGRRVS